MIPTQEPWNSSHLEHPRESCEPVKAGQRRKCHIIDLAECSSILEAEQRGKCNRIGLSERPGVAQPVSPSRFFCDAQPPEFQITG